ncbi:hypothetical protein [Pseudomonas donghuensis]|uniref:hypothetical protein n=1 Tax=Pseudomonas donghuensis TaxID=1163398 RepID=UPI000299FDA8|nr:hypothetical protein [Pseudomonas donghuensis]
MQIQRTYEYAGHFGIVFHVSQLVVLPGHRARLRELHISEAKGAHYEVNTMLVALYDRMQAGNRACEMKVAISRALSRQQADRLNSQRQTVSTTVAGAFAGFASWLINPLIGKATNTEAGDFIKNRIPTHHAGDVIVSLQASVSGGIGPQRSASSMIIENQG